MNNEYVEGHNYEFHHELAWYHNVINAYLNAAIVGLFSAFF